MLPFLKPIALLLGPITLLSSAFAGEPLPSRLCQQAADELKGDDDLEQAMRAAFGEPGFTQEDTCLYPAQVLRFADVDVLVTQNAAPETICDTCQADLNATVLRRIPGGFKRVRTFVAFGKGGGHAAIPSISPIAVGGDDALAIEAGEQTQGYLLRVLDLYAFRRQGLVHLDSGGILYIEGDNEGATSDQSKTIGIDSAWSVAGDELVIDYHVTDSAGQHSARAVWNVGESRLTLKSGAPPKEMSRAAGLE